MKTHVGIDCPNLESTVKFFEDAGFRMAFSDQNRRSACVEVEGFEVSLFENTELQTWRQPALRSFHVGLQIKTLTELVDKHRALSDNYETTAIASRDDGDTYFFAKGPADLRLEFYCGDHLEARHRDRLVASSQVSSPNSPNRRMYGYADRERGLVRGAESLPADVRDLAPASSRDLLERYQSLHSDMSADFMNAGTEDALSAFRAEGSVQLTNPLRAETLAKLGEYYSQSIEAGFWQLGDVQCGTRYWVNNEPLSRHLQMLWLPQLRAWLGESIQPTFSTVMRYQAGSVLEPHRDREQAWYTVTMQIKMNDMATWPFWVAHPSGDERLAKCYQLKNGEAVLFSGHDLSHWRAALEPNNTCLMLCLHFAKEDYHGLYR